MLPELSPAFDAYILAILRTIFSIPATLQNRHGVIKRCQ